MLELFLAQPVVLDYDVHFVIGIFIILYFCIIFTHFNREIIIPGHFRTVCSPFCPIISICIKLSHFLSHSLSHLLSRLLSRLIYQSHLFVFCIQNIKVNDSECKITETRNITIPRGIV